MKIILLMPIMMMMMMDLSSAIINSTTTMSVPVQTNDSTIVEQILKLFNESVKNRQNPININFNIKIGAYGKATEMPVAKNKIPADLLDALVNKNNQNVDSGKGGNQNEIALLVDETQKAPQEQQQQQQQIEQAIGQFPLYNDEMSFVKYLLQKRNNNRF